ncbi:hypothetical protein PIB30_094581 [Stylosanthes scabra]|uniref:Uncharacterized protein n=1 Tax=Stylosanthes scabra TaxID=79078 RepID=A0ABU6ZUT3_9FABA|nr:hypothetical protein [Stylosanthes scabra]
MSYDKTLRAFQRENQEMREAQKRTESQLNHLTEMLQKFTSQQVQPQPPAPSPLPSKPLPSQKGSINVVRDKGINEDEDEDEDVEWLYELLAKLVDSDGEEDKESEEESDEEDEDESVEAEGEEESDKEEDESELAEEEDIDDRDKGKTFFINTLFKGKKSEEEIPIKYASIVSVIGIAENVLVRIGELTIPAYFHIIKPTKREKKGGTPQVLLGKRFLKTAEFKLIYYDEIFTFSVGSAIETFHLTPPLNLQKKGIHQLQTNNGRTQGGSSKEEKKTEAKVWKGLRGRAHDVVSENSPASKGKKKKVVLNPEKKKKKKEPDGSNVKKDPKKKKKKELNEDESERKKPIKCSSFRRFLGRLKVLKDVLCRNKSMDIYLVKNNSKWK